VNTPLDRDALRARLRMTSDHQRRLVLERIVEQLPDADLARLLDGIVHLDEHPAGHPVATPSLAERVARHAAATRRGQYLGKYILRNAHGQREPTETAEWLAASSHLFECALERAHLDPNAETLNCLRVLTRLVEEVDQRPDELLVFEDDRASDHLIHEYPRTKRLLESLDLSSRDA